jgi:hypothetical protein
VVSKPALLAKVRLGFDPLGGQPDRRSHFAQLAQRYSFALFQPLSPSPKSI